MVYHRTAKTAFWWRKAAEQGDIGAQYGLGLAYQEGQGVPRDYAEAYFSYELAAVGELDSSNAKNVTKFQDEAALHMTPTDILRAHERARKWLEAHPTKPQ